MPMLIAFSRHHLAVCRRPRPDLMMAILNRACAANVAHVRVHLHDVLLRYAQKHDRLVALALELEPTWIEHLMHTERQLDPQLQR
jgi:hypothetical protein